MKRSILLALTMLLALTCLSLITVQPVTDSAPVNSHVAANAKPLTALLETVIPTGQCGTIIDCRNCQGQCETWALDQYSACSATGNDSAFCWDSSEKFKYQCGMTYCPNCTWVKVYYYVP